MQVEFTIPGQPVPKGRARSSRNDGRHRTPKRTRDYEKRVAQEAWLAGYRQGWKLTDQPIRLSCEFRLTSPAKPKGVLPTTPGEPDLSNLIKAIEDGAQGTLWENDSQITDYGRMSKRYAADPSDVGATIRAETVT